MTEFTTPDTHVSAGPEAYAHIRKRFIESPFAVIRDNDALAVLHRGAKRQGDKEVLDTLNFHLAPRTMKMEFREHKDYHHSDRNYTYKSAFDPMTGTIVREIEVEKSRYSWNRVTPRSPSPETVDISITDYCPMGCSFCYQDSRTDREHGPIDLLETVIKGFNVRPYQVAIGGGEPVLHPDFPEILKRTRMLGVVPNYTTSGIGMKPEVIEATNLYCGGVAMTFHAFKGVPFFRKHYMALKEALNVQLNVHLIADKDVAKNLETLVKLAPEIGRVNLVLLAYYPDVGRADYNGLMPKDVFNDTLPKALKRAQDANFQIAFSEGLLPYFLSRPQLGVDTSFAMAAEGRFSCYVDPKGYMHISSFSDSPVRMKVVSFDEEGKEDWKWDTRTVYERPAQELWENVNTYHLSSAPFTDACDGCPQNEKCSAPHDTHFLACARMKHNRRR